LPNAVLRIPGLPGLDETDRQAIFRLLVDEEAKLAALEGDKPAEERKGLIRSLPVPPVRRTHLDPLLGFCVDPANKKRRAGSRFAKASGLLKRDNSDYACFGFGKKTQ